MKTQSDTVSYGVGLQIGRDFKRQEINLSPELMVQGIRDGMSDAKARLTDEQIQTVMAAFQADLMAKRQVKNASTAAENKQKGEEFLAANQTKEGVKTLPSGLQYKVLKDGAGPMPKVTSTVTVNYRGRLIDGRQFDSSYERNQPATFEVGGVIPGWTEALQLMRAGSTFELYVPANLAYGEAGRPPTIEPNSTLIFEVELLSFK